MKEMKKFIVLCAIIIGMAINTSFAQNNNEFYYETATKDSTIKSNEMTELATIMKNDSVTNSNGVLSQIRKLFELNKYGDEKPAEEYVKMLLNMAL